MLGYLITDKELYRDHTYNCKDYDVKSFKVLKKNNNTNIYIITIKNNLFRILYKNDIENNACLNEHYVVLDWYKKSGYKINMYKYTLNNYDDYDLCVLAWYVKNGFKKQLKEIINKAFNYVWGQYHTTDFDFYIFNTKYINKLIYIFNVFKKIFILKLFKLRYVDSSGFEKKFIIKYNYLIKTLKYKTKNKYLKGYKKN